MEEEGEGGKARKRGKEKGTEVKEEGVGLVFAEDLVRSLTVAMKWEKKSEKRKDLR